MKILIADDDVMVTVMLSDHLSEMGHETICVHDGQALVEKAISEKPDLIISDIRMPGTDGVAAQGMFDMYPPLQGIPIVFITGVPREIVYSLGIPGNIPLLGFPVRNQFRHITII